MNKDQYLIIHKEALPEVFNKVIQAKEIIKSGKSKGVTEVCKSVGISRSTFYKYNELVFPFSESPLGKKVTISMLLFHESGVLSNLLDYLSKFKCSILTINQDIPINKIANASITIDVSHISIPFNDILTNLRIQEGVMKLELIAME